MQEAGELASNTLVTTVMSNLGLHQAMRSAGVTVRTTGVGDRYVLEELRSGEYSLGGEQSGHIVMPAHGSTGDGIVTGLRLMTRMVQTGSSLADLAAPMQSFPQVLINVTGRRQDHRRRGAVGAQRGRRGRGRTRRHRSNPVAPLGN